jgi:hypothetical protein
MIVTAGRTYRGYISHIEESMRSIENHIQAIAKNAQERANWQVASLPPKTETPVSTGGGLFSWFSGSSVLIETKKTPEQPKSPREEMVEDNKN